MWYEDWFGHLCYGYESIFAFRPDASRTMRATREMRPRCIAKHITGRCVKNRHSSTAATDG